MNLSQKIEAILFVASAPLTLQKLTKATEESVDAVKEAIDILKTRFNTDTSGLRLLESDGTVQLATSPEYIELVDGFIKRDLQGELTRAQLETLTVVAYRGPITRPEIEQIRGVNCAVILRNLMMRGLVQEVQEKDALLPTYSISVEVLAHLGISSSSELPNFDLLSKHAHIEQVVNQEEQV